MTRKFLDLFSVNDPGWGNSHNSGGSKDAKDGQGSDQAPKVDPDTNKPVETQPNNRPAKPDGPPDLDELQDPGPPNYYMVDTQAERLAGTTSRSTNQDAQLFSSSGIGGVTA